MNHKEKRPYDVVEEASLVAHLRDFERCCEGKTNDYTPIEYEAKKRTIVVPKTRTLDKKIEIRRVDAKSQIIKHPLLENISAGFYGAGFPVGLIGVMSLANNDIGFTVGSLLAASGLFLSSAGISWLSKNK